MALDFATRNEHTEVVQLLKKVLQLLTRSSSSFSANQEMTGFL